MWKQQKKSISKIAFVLISLLMAACGGSDPVDVSGGIVGTVYDSDNNPLQGVSMTLTPLGKTTTTGQNGTYSFNDIDAGSYRVQARKSGYQEDTKTVNVSVGGNSTLDFGNDNTTLTLDIKNTGSAQLSWQVSEDVSWLQCIPTSGTTQAGQTSSVIVNVDRTGLSRGNYSQTLAISSNGGSAVVKVNMGVQGLTVSISPEELDFGPTTTSLQLTLTYTGTKPVSYTLTPSNDWIKPSKPSGMFTFGSDVVTVAVDRSGLNTGDYTGALKVTIGEDHVDIPVRMNVPSKEKPTVTLTSVENVTYNTAQFKGGIISIGSQKITKHGFCWDTKEQPTTSASGISNLGDCTAAKDFEYNASGLQPGTKYYVRAYAENAEGVSYSNQMVFETQDQPQVPSVETGAVSGIQATQATVSGNILKIGNDGGITQYGHVWNTSAEPTTAHNKTSLGTTSTTGSFSSTLNGLSPNVTYHVRAYATNSLGTAYGEEITFTTTVGKVTLQTNDVTDVTHNAATGSGTISQLEGNTITERGVCWATTANPTLSAQSAISSESGNTFKVRMTGLSTETTYHVRAYVKTQKGEVFFGNDMSFQTTHEIVLPTVSNTQVTEVGVGKATFSSAVTGNGKGKVSDAGFVYSLNENPTTADTRVSCGAATGNFGKTVTGLKESTTYHVRAYAINEAGTAYSADVTFTTLEVSEPQLSNVTVSNISNTSAQLDGKVSSTGNGTLTDAGFVYSTSHYPTVTDNKLSCGKTTTLNSKMTGLTPETTYYVRAYATNEKGTSYSAEKEFKTSKTAVNPYTSMLIETSYGSTTLDMAKVTGGTFLMGAHSGVSTADNYDPNAYDDEKPTHKVTVSDFYMSKTLVTQYLWYVVMGSYPNVSSQFGLGEDYPVYQVSYQQCEQFMTKLHQLTGKTFRFPTEAEWEFAARGGNNSGHTYYSGNSVVGNVAWYSGNASGKTHPVAQKTANELNIYDMSGNLWEWCSDWYGNYSATTQTNPKGPTSGNSRVIRGGSWNDEAKDCRVSVRSSANPSTGYSTIGLRLVME